MNAILYTQRLFGLAGLHESLVYLTASSTFQVMMWADTSVRIYNVTEMKKVMERTRSLGIQQPRGWIQYGKDPYYPSPIRTVPATYEFFGDSPCAHWSWSQVGRLERCTSN